MDDFERYLSTNLDVLDIETTTSTLERLLDYLSLLRRWNQAFNLTSVSSLQAMVHYHILDSLTTAPYLKGRYILDVGTGAGLPGVPLACVFEDKQFTLIDSVGKKTRFLQQVKYQLQLDNIEIKQCRVEQYKSRYFFDTIISRAVGTIAKIVSLTGHLTHDETRWIVMKTVVPEQELTQTTGTVTVHPVQVPGINEPRHLVVQDGTYHSNS